MTRFTRGKLAVLVTSEVTHYVDRPNETRQRAYLYVASSVSRDGTTPRKVRDVDTVGTPYVSEIDHNAANVRGAWYATTADVDPLDVARMLKRATDGQTWMATPADVRAAIRWAMHGYYPGAHVFYRGQSGTVTAANDNGTYALELTSGETVTDARAADMAHR